MTPDIPDSRQFTLQYMSYHKERRKIIMKFKEPFRPVLLNLSVGLIERLDARAADLAWTRSDLVRHFLSLGLATEDTLVQLGQVQQLPASL